MGALKNQAIAEEHDAVTRIERDYVTEYLRVTLRSALAESKKGGVLAAFEAGARMSTAAHMADGGYGERLRVRVRRIVFSRILDREFPHG